MSPDGTVYVNTFVPDNTNTIQKPGAIVADKSYWTFNGVPILTGKDGKPGLVVLGGLMDIVLTKREDGRFDTKLTIKNTNISDLTIQNVQLSVGNDLRNYNDSGKVFVTTGQRADLSDLLPKKL